MFGRVRLTGVLNREQVRMDSALHQEFRHRKARRDQGANKAL